MAVNIQGFNVGTDVSFVVTDNLGDIFIDSDMGYLDDFSSNATARILKIVPITTGGRPVLQTVWEGGSGRMRFTRYGPSFQQMWMDMASAYHGAGIIPQFSLAQAVRNRDSSIDEYVFNGVQFGNPNFGDFRGNREVGTSVSFEYSTLTSVGAALASLVAGVAQAA